MGSKQACVFGSRMSRLASSRAVALEMALQVVSLEGMEVMGGKGHWRAAGWHQRVA